MRNAVENINKMKKYTYLFCLLLAASILFTSCREREEDTPENEEPYVSSSLDGVVINGVRWATRNVDAPGTFAASPERAGMFFQWSRRKGWPATGDVTDWDETHPTSAYWTRAKDPCPVGWRIPTIQEFILLSEATTGTTFDSYEYHYFWISRNWERHWVENWRNTGANGWILGVAPNFIFLPAAGLRNWRGVLQEVGVFANYWSSTVENEWREPGGMSVWTSSGLGIGTIGNFGPSAMSIRCVAEN